MPVNVICNPQRRSMSPAPLNWNYFWVVPASVMARHGYFWVVPFFTNDEFTEYLALQMF